MELSLLTTKRVCTREETQEIANQEADKTKLQRYKILM
jgi:hypothetical protein